MCIYECHLLYTFTYHVNIPFLEVEQQATHLIASIPAQAVQYLQDIPIIFFLLRTNVKYEFRLQLSPQASSVHCKSRIVIVHAFISSGVQLGAEVASVSGKMCGATQLDWNPSDPKQVADPPRCLALCLILPRPLPHSAWLSHCLALYLALISLAPCLVLTSRHRCLYHWPCFPTLDSVWLDWPLMVSSHHVLDHAESIGCVGYIFETYLTLRSCLPHSITALCWVTQCATGCGGQAATRQAVHSLDQSVSICWRSSLYHRWTQLRESEQ